MCRPALLTYLLPLSSLFFLLSVSLSHSLLQTPFSLPAPSLILFTDLVGLSDERDIMATYSGEDRLLPFLSPLSFRFCSFVTSSLPVDVLLPSLVSSSCLYFLDFM